METFFIGMLLLILIFEHGEETKHQIVTVLHKNPKSLLKYLGATSIFALCFTLLPSLFITIYMREHKFWAYEVFGEQSHSINILSLNVFFNFLLLAFGMFYSAFLIATNSGKWQIFTSVIINIFLIILISLAAISSGKHLLIIAILVFSVLINSYLYFWVKNGIDEKARLWWLPLVFAGMFIILPIFLHEGASTLTESGLMQMKVGGFDVALQEPNQIFEKTPIKLTARLFLRTPEYLYLGMKTAPDNIVIVKADHYAVEYK